MTSKIEKINLLLKEDKLIEAEQLARDFLKEETGDVELKILLARLLAFQEKLDESVDLLNEVLGVDEKNFDALYLLAAIKEQQKLFEDALTLFHRLAGLDNKNPKAYYRIGLIHTKYDYDGKSDYWALHYLRQAVSKENPPAGAFLELSDLEKSQRALYVLQNGLKAYPQDERLHQALCRKYYYSENYTDCLDAISIARNQNVNTEYLDELEVMSLFGISKYNDALTKYKSLDQSESQKAAEVQLFEGLLYCEVGDFATSAKLLRQVIVGDVSNSLDYKGHIFLVRSYLLKEDFSEAFKAFDEIPITQRFDHHLYLNVGNIVLDIEKYYLETLAKLVDLEDAPESIVIKAKLFQSIHKFSPYIDVSNLTADQLKEIKNVFLDVLNLNPRETTIYADLYAVSFQLGNLLDAVEYYFYSEIYGDSVSYRDFDNKILESLSKNNKSIEKLLVLIGKIIKDNFYLQNKFAEKCLRNLISFFFSKQKYQVVIDLANIFSYSNILSAESVFEVAYSYVELKDKKRGRDYYKAYLRDIGDNGAVLNNLSILEEDLGNLGEADRLLRLAIEIEPSHEKAKNNLSRVTERIQKEEEHKRSFQKAVDLFQQETEEVKRLALILYALKTDDDLIYCNFDKLSEITKNDFDELEYRVNDLVRKKYFEEVKNTSETFDGKVLRVNQFVAPLLEKEQKNNTERSLINSISNDLLSDNLERKFGYGQALLDNLKVVRSQGLSKALERDLYETVVALVVKSYKSSLILCGSIAEAVLLDCLLAREQEAIKALEKIYAKEGKQIRSDDKQLNRWVLDRLLDVALELRVITENLYHWGHGLRGFRNLVHPGVEQRQSMEVSRENAEMAWNVVKRLLSEIRAKEQA